MLCTWATKHASLCAPKHFSDTHLADDVLPAVDPDHVATDPLRPGSAEHGDRACHISRGRQPSRGVPLERRLGARLVPGDLPEGRGIGYPGADGVDRDAAPGRPHRPLADL